MSTPGIGMRRSPRQRGRGRITPTQGRAVQRGPGSKVVAINFSSESSDSIDDIPLINTVVKKGEPVELVPQDISSESSDKSEEEEQVVKPEVDWSNKKTVKRPGPPRGRGGRRRKRPIRKHSNRTEEDQDQGPIRRKNDKSSEEDEEEEVKPKKKRIQKKSMERSEPESEEEEEVKEKEKTKPAQQPVVKEKIIKPEPPIPEPNTELQTFNLVRDQKQFMSAFHFCFNDQVVFFATEHKDHLSKFFAITKETDSSVESSTFQGLVREYVNRYIIVSNETKPHDDRDGELVGIAIMASPEKKSKTRLLNIALPTSGKPHFAVSQRRSLSNIAALESPPPNGFVRFNGHSFIKENEQIEESYTFDKIYIISSVKNFIVLDENKRIILMIYKTSGTNFGMKFRHPITPLMAFGIGIAVVSNK